MFCFECFDVIIYVIESKKQNFDVEYLEIGKWYKDD